MEQFDRAFDAMPRLGVELLPTGMVESAFLDGLAGAFFFFNDTATTEIYTLSLHDALPISLAEHEAQRLAQPGNFVGAQRAGRPQRVDARTPQRFDVINVPHSGDATLVEQQRLDRGAAAQLQELTQPARREPRCQRLDAQHPMERQARVRGVLGGSLRAQGPLPLSPPVVVFHEIRS